MHGSAGGDYEKRTSRRESDASSRNVWPVNKRMGVRDLHRRGPCANYGMLQVRAGA